MQNVTNFFSYFDPTTDKFDGSWNTFDSSLTFAQQLWSVTVTALAALVSLPILGLGGLAAFRAMVNHYVPYTADDLPNTPAGKTAGTTHGIGVQTLNKMTENQFVSDAKLLFINESDSELESILKALFAKYKNGRILLNALKVGNPAERLEIVKNAQQLDGSFTSVQEFTRLMRFINEMKAKWDTAIPKLVELGQGLLKVTEFKHLYEILESIPVDEEDEVIKAAETIIDNFKSALDRAQCLNIIQKRFSKGQRVEQIAKYQVLLQTVTSPTKLAQVLSMLDGISKEKQSAIETLVQRLSKGEEDGTLLEKSLRCVNGISEDVAVRLLDNISKCIDDIGGENLLPVLQIFNHVASLPLEKRVDVVAAAMTHIQSSMDPVERRLIMSALCDLNGDLTSVDQSQLKEMVKQKMLIMQFLSNSTNMEDKQEIIDEIQRIPEDQRNSLFAAISPAMNKIANAAQFKELIKGVKMIAPQHRNNAIAQLDEIDARFNWVSVVDAAFRSSPDAKRDTKAYLAQILRTETNRETALSIARSIETHRVLFEVQQNEHDELYMLLLAIIPPDRGNFDSPYDLYNSLVMMDKNNPTPAISTLAMNISGVRAKLNQPHFEKVVRDSKKLTFGDLKPPITKESLKQLFRNFEERLGSLPSSVRDGVWGKGVSGCILINGVPSAKNAEHAYQLARQSFLGSSYIPDTLNLRGDDSQVVPTGYLHMFAVFKYVMNCSSEINASTGLSDQEETMLRMISSIQHCPTGKSEGFAAFYGQLPLEARSYGSTKASTQKEKAVVFLNSVMQSILGDYLTQLGPMARELIERDHDSQFVHTAKYLKNLIGKRVGLDWSIAFDAHPGCINSTLRGRSVDYVLRIFYKHFTPKELVQLVLHKVNEDIIPNLEEIKRIDRELASATQAFETAMQEPNLKRLQEELDSKLKVKNALAARQRECMPQIQGLRSKQNETGLAPTQEAALGRLERELKAKKAEIAEITPQIEKAKGALADEKAKQGVDQLEKRIESIEEGLGLEQKKAKQELINQLNKLFGGESTEGCLEAIDSTEMLFRFREKGIVKLLIQAGYLEAA